MKVVFEYPVRVDAEFNKRFNIEQYEHLGYFDSTENRMMINASLDPCEKLTTILHEILHFFVFKLFGDSRISCFLNDVIDLKEKQFVESQKKY